LPETIEEQNAGTAGRPGGPASPFYRWSDASGKSLIKLQKEQGFDFQLARFAQANRPRITGGEIMSTRAMIAVEFNQNGRSSGLNTFFCKVES
jgi:hypothetical protein